MSHSRTLSFMPGAGLTKFPGAVFLTANAIFPKAEVLMRWLQLLPLVGVLSCPISSAQAASHDVSAALADPLRGRDAQADERRHPAELMEFASVKPGDTVVDLVPGGGYFTRIFSRIVGSSGHVYAVWPIEYAKIDGDEVEAVKRLAADPAYSNVSVLVEPAAIFSIPVKADVVWTSQNYHDYLCKFMGPVDTVLLARSILQSLKPGGLFVVVDHAAEEGSGLRDTEAMHRVDPQLVKTRTIEAGFRGLKRKVQCFEIPTTRTRTWCSTRSFGVTPISSPIASGHRSRSEP